VQFASLRRVRGDRGGEGVQVLRAVQAAIEVCRGRVLGRSPRAVATVEHAVELPRGAEDKDRLPDAELALARALPASASLRAVELARSARSGYGRQRGTRKPELSDVDAWLAVRARSADTASR
jgi:hypothetical protein